MRYGDSSSTMAAKGLEYFRINVFQNWSLLYIALHTSSIWFGTMACFSISDIIFLGFF